MNADLSRRIAVAHDGAVNSLIGLLGSKGHWEGELSSSALSTATAVVALTTMDSRENEALVTSGLRWLGSNQNADGGWGDTVLSRSNLSTTALVWAAYGAAGADSEYSEVVRRARDSIERMAGSFDNLIPAIEKRYGKDRTFSVPIVMTLALSGRLGSDGWKKVRPLPFELASLPRKWFGAMQLPVVSYALPALIAIGQAIFHHAPRFNPLRSVTRNRTLDVLTNLQPANGGFLEATPLTRFVTMSLGSMGLRHHIVARRGVEFLKKSAREDGSWAIDTSLGTWVTTLSIKALGDGGGLLDLPQRSALCEWLLGQQYQLEHPYTGAAPGGWAWIDAPGGVPDADDTAGALIALHALKVKAKVPDQACIEAAGRGVEWLLGLQNRDGGIPTFCRGWGALDFDRSTPEITAHTLRAWDCWRIHLGPAQEKRVVIARQRGMDFLLKSQRPDGAWIPLWFGNESTSDGSNPVYGTAQVIIGLAAISDIKKESEMFTRGTDFLIANQNSDGGWGGGEGTPSSVEETSVALEALAPLFAPAVVIERGVEWLLHRMEQPEKMQPAPIGLYFAKLWYYERQYPLIFATGALERLRSQQR